MIGMRGISVIGWVLWGGLLMGWSQGAALHWLGTLPGGTWSIAKAVNDQGQVVGIATDGSGQRRAFLWSNGMMQDLGTLGGAAANAYGISADGSTVVGVSTLEGGAFRAVRWRMGVIEDLGTLGGNFSMAQAVSADGQVVVGGALNRDGNPRAFRWTPHTGMIDLGTLGGVAAYAYAVDATGNTIAGYSQTASGRVIACRWQVGQNIAALGTLGGGESEAYAISADGSVIAGMAQTPDRWLAFRWTAGTGMQPLHPLDDPRILFSRAYGVNGDGSVIVGDYTHMADQPITSAFRWQPTSGLHDLNEVYASLLMPGDQLVYAYGVSPGGRYVVGVGWHQGQWQAFLLDTGRCYRRTDVNDDGITDDADLLVVLFAFGCGADCAAADVNQDGIVDDADLLMVLFNFGTAC